MIMPTNMITEHRPGRPLADKHPTWQTRTTRLHRLRLTPQPDLH